MNFTEADLRPALAGFTAAKSVSFHIPHTPFWNEPNELVDQKTRGFHGDDFFIQNKTTNEYEEDLPSNPEEARFVADDPICGFDAYSLSTTVDYDAGSADPYDGTLEIAYVFDETLNEVRLEYTETGNHFGAGLSNTRTPTTHFFGNQYADPAEHVIETFTEAVDKTTLEDYLDDWRSRPEEFRDITGNGLATYAYIGHGATKSESDGYLAEVGGGDVRALPYIFTEFSSSGMTGDIAALWNGNFTAAVLVVTRENLPILHYEQSAGGSWEKDTTRIGSSLYREGYSEIELSEPITSWRDDYGVFEIGDELDDAPLLSAAGHIFVELANYTAAGKGNEGVLISRDGEQYRVTLEYRDWSSTISSEVVVTDVSTLRTPPITMELPEGAYSVRVAKIERKVGEDWVIVSDIAEGDAPGNLITSSVRQSGLLLSVIRYRNGERWGHYPLDFEESPFRYRVKTSRIHTTPGTITLSDGDCGGDVEGSYDAEWVHEYDAITGVLNPRAVTEWEAVINGVNWTPPEPPASVPESGTLVTSTATINRWESTSTLTGRFIVAFDVPDPNGKIVSTATVSAAVSFTGGINLSAEVPLLPPASGRSVFVGGFRLRQ